MRRSLRYLILAIGCFAGCVIIVMFFSEWAIIRGFLGDVLVVALVYFLLKVGYEFRPQRLAPAVLAVAVLVEGAQYLQVARHVGLAGNEAVQLVFGSVFDPVDLLAYASGTVLVAVADTAMLTFLRTSR